MACEPELEAALVAAGMDVAGWLEAAAAAGLVLMLLLPMAWVLPQEALPAVACG